MAEESQDDQENQRSNSHGSNAWFWVLVILGAILISGGMSAVGLDLDAYRQDPSFTSYTQIGLIGVAFEFLGVLIIVLAAVAMFAMQWRRRQ